jgi:site-specific DNA-methyltransferase (adenine-specific)
MNRIVLGENLDVLKQLQDASAELIYIDPPFNTGKRQVRPRLKMIRDEEGDRTGFAGVRYRTEKSAESLAGYLDSFDDYVGFLRPRMIEARRILTAHGSLFLHVDPREVHYCKVMLDQVFGRECFQNEIIWAYDYGARATKKWPATHDHIPYMAPKLVGAAKAARGKTPTDVWWHTIVSPTGKEKTGYATQKPIGILERIIKVHSRKGDRVLDFFAGSGTTGAAAAKHGREFLLIDESAEAVGVMEKRLGVKAERKKTRKARKAASAPAEIL